MRRRRLLAVPLFVLAVSAGALPPAEAVPPRVLTGTFVVTSFTLTPGASTGAVTRFSFDLTATSSGDLPGTFVEHQDCQRVADVVRCRGYATTRGADGSTGELRSLLTCTPLLACEGKSQGRGTGPDGERQVWMTDVSTPGDGTGTYVTRFVRP